MGAVQPPTDLRIGSNRLLGVLDVYWRSPESGDLWYKSRQLKKMVWGLVACSVPSGETSSGEQPPTSPLLSEEKTT